MFGYYLAVNYSLYCFKIVLSKSSKGQVRLLQILDSQAIFKPKKHNYSYWRPFNLLKSVQLKALTPLHFITEL